ncbi:OTU domain-containing protein [Endozoicomonas lisbonensis]|uniref:OTU domain-containing protein n=1 Tax=Endozoicomonas lisbonensis TaxID=3120522 RepID=UPI00339AAD2C
MSKKRGNVHSGVKNENTKKVKKDAGSNLRFFIEKGYAGEEETDSVPGDGVKSPPFSGSMERLSSSPLGISPARLSSMKTGRLYDEKQAKKRRTRNKNRRSSQSVGQDSVDTISHSAPGWFIRPGGRQTVFDCNTVDLFNPAKFGSSYEEYARQCRFFHGSPLPSDRQADFIEVFVRAIDGTSFQTERAYIHDDLLCIVKPVNDPVMPMTFELCVRFQRYDRYSLSALARNEFIPVDNASSDDKAFDEKVDSFLRAFEAAAKFEMCNEHDELRVDVAPYGKVRVRCIGRGQCKAVFEFPELFPGLAFSWQRGHSMESALLLEGLQGASLTVYEELAMGWNQRTGTLVDTDQIKKPAHKSIDSTRMPSVYRLIPAADDLITVVEIQHRIQPEHLAQTYIRLALTHGLDHRVEIPVVYRDEAVMTVPSFYGEPVKETWSVLRTELMQYTLRDILAEIFEALISQLAQFTGTLEDFRSLRNIPVSIGVDSKLPNYYVSFYLGLDGSLRADLKNFDNEPPNLKLLNGGEPLYRGGPLYDLISRLFPESRLQEDFVDRIQKITVFRSLLKKLLASIAADYFKVQATAKVDLQWFIDLINYEAKSQEVSETPVTWSEIEQYMQKSKKSHRAFRLYVWACQMAAQLQPGRVNVPPAFIPVNHDQKEWLEGIQNKYRHVVAGLILQNRFDKLDQLLQSILNHETDSPSDIPLTSDSWLLDFLARMRMLDEWAGSRFSDYMNRLYAGHPVVSALDAMVDEFLHTSESLLRQNFKVEDSLHSSERSQQDFKDAYASYCLWARLPFLNTVEHAFFHSWWDAWRQVRLQCGTASGRKNTPPSKAAIGKTARGKGMEELFRTLNAPWKSTLEFSSFHHPQPALAQLFGLSFSRTRALIHRLLFTVQGGGAELATQWLYELQQWFDPGVVTDDNDYRLLALFSGLFLKERIHVFEFIKGQFAGIRELGMSYNENKQWVEHNHFIPPGQVDLSLFAPREQRQTYILFHNIPQKVPGQKPQKNWYSVGIHQPPSQADPDIDGIQDQDPMDVPDAQYSVDPARLNQAVAHNPVHLEEYVQNLNTLFTAASFTMIHTPGDNSCLYHAIAEVLTRKLGRPVGADEVKSRIRRFLATLKHKFQLNLGANNNQDPHVVEPYTSEELYLLNMLGPQLDLLDAEINVEGVWNDYSMIIIAANAFQTDLTFVVPYTAPVQTTEDAAPHIVQVYPAQDTQVLSMLPYESVVFFTGAPHWEAAEPHAPVGSSILEVALPEIVREHGLAAVLALLQGKSTSILPKQ